MGHGEGYEIIDVIMVGKFSALVALSLALSASALVRLPVKKIQASRTNPGLGLLG